MEQPNNTVNKAPQAAPLRAAICWPAPRLDRIKAALDDPSRYEQMDGLSYLPAEGVTVQVIDASPGYLNPLSKRGSLLAGIDPIRFLKQLWNYRQFDVLVCADSSAAFLFVQLKRLLRLRKAVVIIDPALDKSYYNRMRLHSAVLPYVEHVVVFGQVQVDFLQREYGDTVRVNFIKHRMDCRFFDPALPGLVDQPTGGYVLAVGNDVGRDYELLLAAAKDLPVPVLIHTKRKLPLPLPANVRQQSHWISFEQLRLLYAQADVVVMPLKETVHAGGTNGVLEAMAMGKPLVASLSSGIKDYVQDEVTALTPPPSDVSALRACIHRLWSNRTLATKLGSSARAYAIRELAMPVYARQVADVLRRAVRNSDR